jgi:hypothetical protein
MPRLLHDMSGHCTCATADTGDGDGNRVGEGEGVSEGEEADPLVKACAMPST